MIQLSNLNLGFHRCIGFIKNNQQLLAKQATVTLTSKQDNQSRNFKKNDVICLVYLCLY